MGTIVKKERKTGFSYEAKVKVGGKISTRTFRVEKEAAKWIDEEERRLKGGGQVDGWKMKRQSIPDVIDFYIKHVGEDRLKKGEGYRFSFLKRQFVNERVEDITIEALKGYIEGMMKSKIARNPRKTKTSPLYDGDTERTYSAGAVRKYFYALKKILEFHASKNGYELPANLFSKNQQFTVPAGWEGQRDRRLHDGEEKKILDSIEKNYIDVEAMKSIFLFALETAMRSQEIMKARWKDFHEVGRTLNVPKEHVKTRKFRQVPLSRKAMALLQEHRERRGNPKGDDRIFDEIPDAATLSRKWRRVCVRAGIRDLRFHDLRHEATSRLFEKGRLHYLEIADITGHTNLETLNRYLVLIPSRLVDKMD